MTYNSFTFDFLRARYLSLLDRSSRYITSSIWPSLKADYISLLAECKWIVGTHSRKRFWEDNWLGTPIIDILQLPPNSWNPTSQVRDYISATGQWNLPTHFRNSFPQLSLMIDNTCIIDMPDQLIWMPSSSGNVTCKDTYMHLSDSEDSPFWTKHIWAPFIPPSRSTLMWRALQGRLPTDENLVKIGLQLASRCSICKRNTDSIHHVFLQCPYAQGIWNSLATTFGITMDTSSDLVAFFRKATLVSLSDQLFNLWIVGIIASIHTIWYTRNNSTFEDRLISLSSALALVWTAMRDANKVQKGTMKNTIDDLTILRKIGVQGLPSKAPRIIHVPWTPPPCGWIKVNTDGAANGNPGLAGCGGVFRTHRGFFKGGFAFHLGMAFAFESELMGVIKAIDFAVLYNWTSIWLESDSTYVVYLLTNRFRKVPWSLKSRWIRCLQTIDSINFRVSHIFREGNRVADDLSKFAVNHEAPSWWFDILDFCKRSYGEDLIGHGGYRFC